MKNERFFKSGNTSIKIIFPEITEEENERRKQEVRKLAVRIVENSIRKK